MGDVGNDDKAEAAEAGKAPEDTPVAAATATKTAKPRTAAEIVAEQKAREQAAAATPAAPEETTVTKPVSRVTAAPAAKPPVKSAPAGKQALSSVGTGVRQVRNLLASLIWLIAVLAAAMLALGALFTALDQTNQSNEIVRWILERGHDLVGPFKDLFRLETAKNTLLVNWGIAALVYLIAGKIIERFVRP
jgi:anti-sigma factor RsiW